MHHRHTILIGKAIKRLARLRGGGSALPGLVVERIDREFLRHTLMQLPRGVVVVVGTNGKTTTTKIVTSLLRAQGLKIFTNPTGSNFTRGVIAALLGAVDRHGGLPYDAAVIELDEAYAAHFVTQISPTYTLVLNVMRDQLDRFGEIDHTARLLSAVVKATTGHVVLNRDDPRVAGLAREVQSGAHVSYFGADPVLSDLLVRDDELHAHDAKRSARPLAADVELAAYNDHQATFKIGTRTARATLRLHGAYNFLNAAGALALVRAMLGRDVDTQSLLDALADVQPAFGRGEQLHVRGQLLELILVKNPAGFRSTLADHPAGQPVMIAINDDYADGRDMSWLWDVDFTPLAPQVAMVSGVRASDMALRLQYDEVATVTCDPTLTRALARFIRDHPAEPKRIYCTYTAMRRLRRALKKYADVETII